MKFLFFVVGLVAVLAEESQVLKEFTHGNVQYINSLYKELAKVHSENFLVCPLSIQTVFALINGGARGNTAKQITESLHLPEGEEKIKETFLSLGKNFRGDDKYTLSSVNKIYLADYFKISSQYKSTAVDVFDSEIKNIDFGKTHEAAAEINEWVERKTHDKIKDLITEEVIGPDTVAVLINAMYFQGKWVNQFADVQRMPFYLGRGRLVFTNMMSMAADVKYHQSPELRAKFLELPYEGGDISMTFVLPNDYDGLSSLENRIPDILVTPDYELQQVKVFIPKFKIETTTHLIPVLKNLGITDAFSGAADFTGIGENKDSLSISEVIQKAFIEVDEKGTTAAAATAITVDRILGGSDELNFMADHPFIFYLKHKVYGVFFIGRFSVAEAAAK